MKYALIPVFVILTAATLRAEDNPATVWDGLLAEVVKDQRVDYSLLQRRHADSLNAVLDLSEKIDPAQLNDKERLAFYINLYNVSMIKAVLDRGGVAFKPSDNDFQVFKDKLVRLKGGKISLNDLEHQIIRKQFKDARIHAALVCAAVSCPPLIANAYRGDTLDKQLDENVKNWLADTNRNVIDDENKVLKLSSIFKWFAEDFGGEANLGKWVSDKIGRDVSGYRVEFLEYDWTLNAPAKL